MSSPTSQSSDVSSPSKHPCSSPMSSPSSVSSRSTNSKQRPMPDKHHCRDEIMRKIKVEEGTDEVKIFSASTILKHEPDDDVDVDGIEDRLSPLVEEPISPTKQDSSNNNLPGAYASPFLYPYFHPMWNPYLMAAAAAQANASASSADKSFNNGEGNHPYGAASPFAGMGFPPGYPPGMANGQFQPNLFNPFNFPMPTPGARPQSSFHRQHPSSVEDKSPKDLNTFLDGKRSRKPHIKKPLNAFMIYMKEQRARVIEECTLKESSAINKVLGQKWKELSRTEQDRYYELAKEERNRHMQLYPGWSARDNYGIKKKRPTMPHGNHAQKKFAAEHHPSPQKHASKNAAPVDPCSANDLDCLNQKKCRARYGLEGLSQWCKHCRRKKKCTRFLEDEQMNGYPGSSMNPSSLSSPATIQSDNDDDSTNDPDSDDILSRQIDSIDDEHDDSDEENHKSDKPAPQQFYLPSAAAAAAAAAHLYQPSGMPSHFGPGLFY